MVTEGIVNVVRKVIINKPGHALHGERAIILPRSLDTSTRNEVVRIKGGRRIEIDRIFLDEVTTPNRKE